MKIPIPPRRSTIEILPDGVRYSFPPKRNAVSIVFCGAWLVAWCFAEFSLIRELVDAGSEGPDRRCGPRRI
jgi:hypothetical protein